MDIYRCIVLDMTVFEVFEVSKWSKTKRNKRLQYIHSIAAVWYGIEVCKYKLFLGDVQIKYKKSRPKVSNLTSGRDL